MNSTGWILLEPDMEDKPDIDPVPDVDTEGDIIEFNRHYPSRSTARADRDTASDRNNLFGHSRSPIEAVKTYECVGRADARYTLSTSTNL